MGKEYPSLRVQGFCTSDQTRREVKEGRIRLRKTNKLGLAGICLILGSLGVLYQGLDCDTPLSTGPGRRL